MTVGLDLHRVSPPAFALGARTRSPIYKRAGYPKGVWYGRYSTGCGWRFLTALLVPWVKGILDRRSEKSSAAEELIDTLAQSSWGYWKLALRVSYGRQGDRIRAEYVRALDCRDREESWKLGENIQIQISKSKRVLEPAEQQKLDQAQQEVVDHLDRAVDQLRQADAPDQWETFYRSLMSDKREQIDGILSDVANGLKRDRSTVRFFRRS